VADRAPRRILPGRPGIVFPNKKKVSLYPRVLLTQTQLQARTIDFVHEKKVLGKEAERNQRAGHAAVIGDRRSGWKTLAVWQCHLRRNSVNGVVRRAVRFLGRG